MYGTVAAWIAYAALRGLTVTDSAASAQALVRASDYIRTRYVLPRAPEYDDPDNETVVEGVYMAAKYELANPGFFAAVVTPSRQVKSAGAGPARVDFFEGSTSYGMDATKIVSAIDALFSRNSMTPAAFVV